MESLPTPLFNLINQIGAAIDKGEYHRDPGCFVEARLLLKNEMPGLIMEAINGAEDKKVTQVQYFYLAGMR